METNAMTQVPQPIPQQAEGPLSASQMAPTVTMLAVAMIGGALNFYKKWKDGNVRAFNLTEFVGEVVISGACGLLCYWTMKGFGVNEWLTAASVGIVGHMGSRAIFIAENAIDTFAKRWAEK